MIDQWLDAHDIAAELTAWWLGWRPARPAAYITARLRDRAAAGPPQALKEDVHQDTTGPTANPAWQAWLRQRAAAPDATAPRRTNDDRRLARLYGWDRWAEIAEHYETDPDDALDLYGTRLCCYAVKRSSETWVRQ